MKTSYYANWRNFPKHLKPVSVSIYPPKGFKGEKDLSLAPLSGLLKDYKEGLVGEKGYVERYKRETLSKLDPAVIHEKHKNSILLCYEGPGDFCHRYIISDWLKENGYECSELGEVKFLTGDIFSSDAEVIVNPVNCEGVVGVGLSKIFKDNYPSHFEKYRKACESKELDIGKLMLLKGKGRKILIFPTKRKWSDKSRYSYIEAGLKKFVDNCERLNITSIAFPLLGAGLDSGKIISLMNKYLSRVNISVTVYIKDDGDVLLAEKLLKKNVK